MFLPGLVLACLLAEPGDGGLFVRDQSPLTSAGSYVAFAEQGHPTGRFALALFFTTKGAHFRLGGQWTRQHPFFVDFPVGPFVILRVMIVLPDEYFQEHSPKPDKT